MRPPSPSRSFKNWIRGSLNHNRLAVSAPQKQDIQVQKAPHNNTREYDVSHGSAVHNQESRCVGSLAIFAHWWQELSACLLSAGMLFTLVAILYTRQGNPLPKWPYHISVNAVVSVLSIILKASMLFALAEGKILS